MQKIQCKWYSQFSTTANATQFIRLLTSHENISKLVFEIFVSKYVHETGRVENPQVTHPIFTCLKSTMETPEQYVKSIQSSEVYLESNPTFFL